MSTPPHAQQADPRLPAALLAAAEHDVRSLLASIELGAATLEARVDDGELAQTGRIVGQASRQLSATLEELVETAGAIVADQTPVAPVDVTGLLGRVLSDCGVPHGALGTQGAVHVAGNEVLLRHLFWNLVANAVAAAGRDRVTAEVVGDRATVTVTFRNPADRPASQAPSDHVLHLEPGRGLRIVKILADAAGVDYAHTYREGRYTARLRIPDRVHHPSLRQLPVDAEDGPDGTVVRLEPPPE